MRSNIEILFKVPKIKRDPMRIKTKLYQEFLLHYGKILNELNISLEYFNCLGKSLGLKNIVDFALFFGSYDYSYEFYDKGKGCNVIYFLNKEKTKLNILSVYRQYKFLIRN